MAEQFGIRLSVSPADLAKSINRAITQINTVGGLRKIKIDADTSEFESAIKRIKTEIASITGRSSTSKIELGTSRADGQITLDELTAFRKAEEALANPVGMAAVQAEFNKTAEIVKNLTTAVSAFKTEYSSIGGINSAGNTNGLIDANAISERIKTAVSGLNITKPVEIPIAFKGVQEAIAALQQQANGTVINFGNSAFNGTGTHAGKTVSNAVKHAAEQATESLKQQAQAGKDVANAAKDSSRVVADSANAEKQAFTEVDKAIENAIKKLDAFDDKMRVTQTNAADGTPISRTVKSGTSIYNVTDRSNYNAESKQWELLNTTIEQNSSSARASMEKMITTAIKLNAELEKVKSSYSDINAARPIKNTEHLDELKQKCDSIAQLIIEMTQADSSQYSVFKANIEAKISDLKNLERGFRNAEYAATKLAAKDINTIKTEEANNLNAFISKIIGSKVPLSEVETEVDKLRESLRNVTDKKSLADYFDQFDIVKAKVKALNAEIKSVSDATKHIGDGIKALDKISGDSTLYRNRGWDETRYAELINAVTTLRKEYTSMQESLAKDSSAENLTKVKEQLAVVDSKLKETVNDAASLKREFGNIKIDDNTARKVAQTHAMIAETMRVNTRAMGQINTASGSGLTFGEEFRRLNDELVRSPELVDRINSQVRVLQSNIKTLGVQGATFFDELKQKASKFLKWTAMTLVITKTRMYLRQLFTTVYELDTELIDLKKTFKGSAEELNDFYFEANKLAKQMGVTTTEIIKQGAAWSRLGYSSNETMKKMAEMSAMFAAISPDMDTETAQNGLVSIMKAFDIDPENVLDGILSKVNIIGNTAATSNGEIVEMLQKSSSAMKEANNTLEETIALETAAIYSENGCAYRNVRKRIYLTALVA